MTSHALAQFEVSAGSQKGFHWPLHFDRKIHRNISCVGGFVNQMKLQRAGANGRNSPQLSAT